MRFDLRCRYAAFKGGSEPGVLSLTCYLERTDGRAFVLSLTLADGRRAIETEAVLGIASTAARLLERG